MKVGEGREAESVRCRYPIFCLNGDSRGGGGGGCCSRSQSRQAAHSVKVCRLLPTFLRSEPISLFALSLLHFSTKNCARRHSIGSTGSRRQPETPFFFLPLSSSHNSLKSNFWCRRMHVLRPYDGPLAKVFLRRKVSVKGDLWL